MSPMVEKIEAEIKKLPASEQVELLERLESLVYGSDEEDSALIKTLRQRIADIESGRVKGIPVEETFEKINQELKAKYS